MSPKSEFAGERRKRITTALIPRTRLTMGDLFADIIEDRRTDPPIVFCVVQRQRSPEIFFLGQYRSRSEAAHAGQQAMSEYLNQRASNTAVQGIA